MSFKSWTLVLLVCVAGGQSAASAASGWPEWDVFARRFVQADGRVIDLTFDGKTTSEGQSYGLFFALVANDRPRFDAMLKWSSDNLAGGNLGKRLPAWLWGKRDDGSWGVKDENAASDADLWMAYTLLEAARLWHEPRHAEIGRNLLLQVRSKEIVQAGSAGPVLLPGPQGFVLDKGRYRVNPSYLPEFMFRYLATADSQGPWQAVWDGFRRMAPKIFQAGVAPDNFVVDSRGMVMADTEREPSGSYDAIRVYLWAGMSGAGNREILDLLRRYGSLIRETGNPPEKVDPRTGAVTKADYSPLGFTGAILPYLTALGEQSMLQQQRQRLQSAASRARQGETTHYYDQVLILFGTGWVDGHYQFDEQGRLVPRWSR